MREKVTVHNQHIYVRIVPFTMSLKSNLLDLLQFKTHKISIYNENEHFWQVKVNVLETHQAFGASTVFYLANFKQEFCMKSRYSGSLTVFYDPYSLTWERYRF